MIPSRAFGVDLELVSSLPLARIATNNFCFFIVSSLGECRHDCVYDQLNHSYVFCLFSRGTSVRRKVRTCHSVLD